jgi:hypothetical protein
MPRKPNLADIATSADIEHTVAALLHQIEEHEGRAVLQQVAERLLNGTVLVVLQTSGLKRLNEVLAKIDRELVDVFRTPATASGRASAGR